MTIAVAHRRLRRSVERLVDREATGREALAARTHLKRCNTCRAAARLLVQMKAALRRAPIEHPSRWP